MAKFKLIEQAPEIFTARVITAAVEKGDPLKFAAGGVEEAGDGDRVDAFATQAGGVGDYIACARGSMRVVGMAATGVDFNVGDDVYLDASQHLDSGSTGDVAVGEVIAHDPETGGLVEIRFDPEGSTVHA